MCKHKYIIKMGGFSTFVAILVLFSALESSTLAIKKSYIVYLGAHSHDSELVAANTDYYHLVKDSHSRFLGSFLASKEEAHEAIIYSYVNEINGFAATLHEEDAAKIASHPEVVSVFENKGLKLHTTHSWDFLLLEKNGRVHRDSLWSKANFGQDVIIGNLDTGVWPESKSFSDHAFGPIPSRWKGTCSNHTIFPCNRKLIGARYFNKGYNSGTETLNSSMNTPRDYDGHGTHTLSTAGGNFVRGASVNGIGNGTAKGGSPNARVAAYKVCWPPTKDGAECYEADIIKGFDAAIQDGVNVLSVSLGGSAIDYLYDSQAIGAFHAVKKGIVVVASAGNDGPTSGSVTNVAPWILTVGASTIDREFQSFVLLHNRLRLKGTSLSKPLPDDTLYSLIDSSHAKAENASLQDAILCKEGGLDRKKAKGKIVVCLRGENARVDKGKEALRAGAVGMILCNDKASGNEIISDLHVLPATHITYSDGLLVYKYLNSSDDPMGYISPPEAVLNTKPAPFMASFSSRGPNLVTPEILKPDITAPGVNIIASISEAGGRGSPFGVESGTSMSCPHVSGVVGLLKSLHPDWSPAAIKSAIMTTARTRANTLRPMVDGTDYEKATPFMYGAGHIRPNHAMDPGLVYDLTINDYLDFLCSLGYNKTRIQKFSGEPYKCPKEGKYSILDFNYPSITVPQLSGTVKVTRKLKYVGTGPRVYAVQVREPAGISVVVEPSQLKFDKVGEEKSFVVSMKAKRGSVSHGHLFGELLWSDKKHYVRSPIVVAVAAAEKSHH